MATLAGRLETEAERVNEVERLDIEQRRQIERDVEELRQKVENEEIEISVNYTEKIPKIEGKVSKTINPDEQIDIEL